MELNKRKYRKAEVLEILEKIEELHNTEISNFKTSISELVEENKKLQIELATLKERETLALETLKSAQEKAEEIEEKSRISYELAIKKISIFIERWNSYFRKLSEKYPYYPEVQASIELKDKVSQILKGKDYATSLDKAEIMLSDKEKQLNGKGSFDPKSKIQDYIASTSDSGFNLDEVLNPGVLKLEDLCKELGLTDAD